MWTEPWGPLQVKGGRWQSLGRAGDHGSRDPGGMTTGFEMEGPGANRQPLNALKGKKIESTLQHQRGHSPTCLNPLIYFVCMCTCICGHATVCIKIHNFTFLIKISMCLCLSFYITCGWVSVEARRGHQTDPGELELQAGVSHLIRC